MHLIKVDTNTTAYSKLIKENVTKSYKKKRGKVVEKWNAQSAKNSWKSQTGQWHWKTSQKRGISNFKRSQTAFHDHPTCRLINPSKSQISVNSKHILDDINTTVINKTKINQWKTHLVFSNGLTAFKTKNCYLLYVLMCVIFTQQ